MSAALDRLRDALNAHGCEPNDRGEARCPAHDDQRASLTFKAGDKGAVSVLPRRMLSSGRRRGARIEAPRPVRRRRARQPAPRGGRLRLHRRGRRAVVPGRALRAQGLPTAQAGRERRLGLEARRHAPGAVPAARGDRGRPGRPHRVRRRGREGRRNPRRLGARRDVQPRRAPGSGKSPSTARALRGARVVIIPDADKPGREHAASIAASLAGVAAEVRTVELPGAKDATAWAAAGGTREALETLCTPNPRPGILMSDVRPELVRWLWPGRIPLGKLTVVDGDPGQGKSTMMLDLAARVSRGRAMPDGASGVRAASSC